MAADEPTGCDAAEQASHRVRDALFAADLKRLVRASEDNDDDTVSALRERWVPDRPNPAAAG